MAAQIATGFVRPSADRQLWRRAVSARSSPFSEHEPSNHNLADDNENHPQEEGERTPEPVDIPGTIRKHETEEQGDVSGKGQWQTHQHHEIERGRIAGFWKERDRG